MTSITSSNASGLSLPGTAAPVSSAGGAAVRSMPDDTALLAQLRDMIGNKSATAQGKGDGITDARGAPAIGNPVTSFSADDMTELLRSIRSKSQDAQLEGAKSGIETARIKAEKNTDSQLKKIEEWVAKSKEAEEKGTLGKIFGWIGKIVAVIAAVAAVAVAAVATVATGGAAAPLLAFAVIGLVGATISLADQISKECGGPEISIGNLLTTMSSKFLEACGVPKEKAEQIGKVMAGVAAVMMPAMLLVEPGLAGTMATGICELAGADKNTTMYVAMAASVAAAITVGIVMVVASGGASAANVGMSTSIKLANTMVTAGAQIAGGVTTAATGAINISKAHTQREAENLLSDKKDLEAAMVKLQKQMEEGREEIKKVLAQIEDGMQAVTQMINGAAESMSQITANLGKRQSV